MQRNSIIIVAGCLTALVLGLILAYPLLETNTFVPAKADLGVDVVYAYFGTLNVDSNITGLYRNNTQLFATNGNEGQITGNTVYTTNVMSYFMVLNITNLSNDDARVNEMDTLAGPSISVSDTGGPLGSGFVEAQNPILTDSKLVSAYAGWDNVWGENQSRLIYLSGIMGVLNSSYTSINRNIWIHVEVNGATYGNTPIIGICYKQLPLETFGQDHLYNNLLGENQTLIFLNEFDVSVGRLLQ